MKTYQLKLSPMYLHLVILAIIEVCYSFTEERKARGPSKIIGGRRAKPGEIPFIVAVLKAYPSYADAPQHCGGSLLSSRHVLTACHCLYSIASERYYSYEYLKFVAGEVNISNTESPWMQTRFGIKFTVYENCTFNKIFEFDFAVATMKEPFELNERVQIVHLYSSETFFLRNHINQLIKEGAIVLVAGWGLVEPDVLRDVVEPYLKVVEMEMITDDECQAMYCQHFASYCDYPFEQKGQFCGIGVKGNESDCLADSGGPVFRPTTGLVGIVSYGMECANPTMASVFARVDVITELMWKLRVELPAEETEVTKQVLSKNQVSTESAVKSSPVTYESELITPDERQEIFTIPPLNENASSAASNSRSHSLLNYFIYNHFI